MARTPEGVVKQAVRDILDQAECMYYHMPVLTGYGRPSLDFIGCSFGRFFAVETKTEKGKVTPRQALTINQMVKAGARVFVVKGKHDVEDLREFVDAPPMTEG